MSCAKNRNIARGVAKQMQDFSRSLVEFLYELKFASSLIIAGHENPYAKFIKSNFSYWWLKNGDNIYIATTIQDLEIWVISEYDLLLKGIDLSKTIPKLCGRIAKIHLQTQLG